VGWHGHCSSHFGEFRIQEKPVLFAKTKRWTAGLWLALVLIAAVVAWVCPVTVMAQQESKIEELTRRPKTKVSPVYPLVARRMSIAGTVRLAVVVAPNGTVKSTRVIGGHPILVNAATDAMKQWRFEPAPTESTGVVEFKFQPQE
jgi:TonB family protein